MPKFFNFLGNPEQEEGALRDFGFQKRLEYALLILREILGFIRLRGLIGALEHHYGIKLKDLPSAIRELINLEQILLDIFQEELTDLNESEQRAIDVIRNYVFLTDELPDELSVLVACHKDFGYSYFIVPLLEYRERKRGKYYVFENGEEREIGLTMTIPKVRNMLIAGNVILRTAKRLGFLSVLKYERPRVLLKDGEA